MRNDIYESVPAERLEVVRTETECDLCHKKLVLDDEGFDTETGEFLNTIELLINPDECVNTRIFRDVCEQCMHTLMPQLQHLLQFESDYA